MHHVMKWTRPPERIISYCKRRMHEGLRTRLKQLSSVWASSTFSWSSKRTCRTHPAQCTSLSSLLTRLTGGYCLLSALTKLPCLGVLDWQKKSLALAFYTGLSIATVQGLSSHIPKPHEQPWYEAKVAIVVYHLVSAPINNSGQAVLCVWGFLHACILVLNTKVQDETTCSPKCL